MDSESKKKLIEKKATLKEDIMKKVLLPLIMCVMFLSGCGPGFSVEAGKSICERIMNSNRGVLSPGDSFENSFKIKSISFKDNYDSGRGSVERGYVVIYEARLHNGKYYDITRLVFVGKDEGGWYVSIELPDANVSTKLRERE